MPRILISDLDDPRIAPYRSLKKTNLTRGSDLFVVEGAKLVERLAASRFPLISVLVTDRAESKIETLIAEDVPRFVVPHERIHDLVGYNFHQGALGCGQRRAWPGLEQILTESRDPLTFVVCPRLDSPDNLGSIVRIADAFGVDALLVGDRCPDPLSRRVLRVSMGSSLRVPVLTPGDLRGQLITLRGQDSLALWATVASPKAEPLENAVVPPRLAVLLGSESAGLDSEWLELSDRQVTIPMRAGVDSLNVAVAAGIILQGVARQRATGAAGSASKVIEP
jgi:tRNA G18 (ribose-2'-O)-methylase SpoU